MKLIPLVCAILCCVCRNFVFVQSESKSWSVTQYAGLDDLYLQIQRQEKPGRINYAKAKNVCDKIIPADSFKTLLDGKPINVYPFRTTIQGELLNGQDTPSLLSDNGFHRYELKTIDEYQFILDLYSCIEVDSKVHFLSYGYENDNLFFLFIYDKNTRQIALEGFVQEDPIAINGNDELLYTELRNSYYHHLFTTFPEKITQDFLLQLDPVCLLDPVKKLKLCNVLLKTPPYINKYIFAASVDAQCSSKLLDMKNAANGAIEYMYRCLAIRIDNHLLPGAIIYIGRGYRNFDVNTFKVVGNEKGVDVVRLENSFRNVHSIIEPYLEKISSERKSKNRHEYSGGAEVDNGHTSSIDQGGYQRNDGDVADATVGFAVDTSGVHSEESGFANLDGKK